MKYDVNVWIYDFEVFKHDWVVTFVNFDTDEKKTFINDFAGLKKFYHDEIELNAICVGYNNKWYDDFILRGLIEFNNPYEISQWIINLKQNPWEFYGLRFKKNKLISFDIMGEMAIGAPISLKQLEGYFGWRIFEMPIPFDIDRPLTKEELDLVVKYNEYDVRCTLEVFKRFGNKLKSHIALINFYNLPLTKLNISGASKAAIALEAKKIPPYNTFNYEIPPIIKEELMALDEEELISLFENTTFHVDKEMRKTNKFAFSKKLNDFEFHFALGGGHGAIENFEYEGEIFNLDVKSYYVSIMCAFNFVSRSLGVNGKQKLHDLLRLRIKFKDEGNVDLADGLKMFLVAIYGSMAYSNSLMWDSKMQTSVCLTGQLLLFILCKQLQEHAKIIQINTDGIMIVPFDKEECEKVYKRWERLFQMELELEVGKRIIQKDVNNYVFVKDDVEDLSNKLEVAKKIKVKGMGVRFFNIRMQDSEFGQLANFTINNNYTIVDEAVVKYLVFNIPVEQTIKQCRDLIRFQFVLKLMGDFKSICYKEGEEYIDVDDGLKCYRLFATLDGKDYFKHKVCEDKDSFVKISKSSSSMKILNDDLSFYNFDDIKIDYDHYIKMAFDIIELYKHDKTEIEEVF